MTGRLLAFDSGIGGLSIVRALRARLPQARIDYLADNALFPYGELPDAVLVERVCSLVGQAIDRLSPDVVVIACNTASTLALQALRARFDRPFVGCVPPVKWLAETSRSRHIGLLATAATVRRPYLQGLRDRFAPDCTLVAHGARGLADIAEAVFRGQPPDRVAIARELDALFGQPGGALIDTVGIGCTHYGFLMEDFRALSLPDIAWLDPADAVARRTRDVLAQRPRGPAMPPDRRGTAWTTAPAPELADGLARFGYAAPRPWPASGTTMPARAETWPA